MPNSRVLHAKILTDLDRPRKLRMVSLLHQVSNVRHHPKRSPPLPSPSRGLAHHFSLATMLPSITLPLAPHPRPNHSLLTTGNPPSPPLPSAIQKPDTTWTDDLPRSLPTPGILGSTLPSAPLPVPGLAAPGTKKTTFLEKILSRSPVERAVLSRMPTGAILRPAARPPRTRLIRL